MKLKRWLAYVCAALVVVSGVTAALWGTLDGAGRAGILWAGGTALVVQGIAFGLLLGSRGRNQGFLLAMAGGIMARFGVLGVAGIVVSVVETGVGAEALVLGLAGFLFALALLEAVFLPGVETMGLSE